MSATVTALHTRLRCLEELTPFGTGLGRDGTSDADLLAALAAARAGSLTELGLKLATLAARARDTAGQLGPAELDLLWSTLRDARRLDPGTTLAVG